MTPKKFSYAVQATAFVVFMLVKRNDQNIFS